MFNESVNHVVEEHYKLDGYKSVFLLFLFTTPIYGFFPHKDLYMEKDDFGVLIVRFNIDCHLPLN